MKLSQIFMMVFVASFLLGVGVIAMTPVNVQAGPTNCDTSCYQFTCHYDASCTFPEVMHQKCYGDARLQDPCSVLTCDCHDVGCGDLCGPP